MRAIIGFITVLALWAGFYFLWKNRDYNEQKRLYEEVFKRQNSIEKLLIKREGYLDLGLSLTGGELNGEGNYTVVRKVDSLFQDSELEIRRLEYEISNIEKELEKYSK